jgi:hypothetical protein
MITALVIFTTERVDLILSGEHVIQCRLLKFRLGVLEITYFAIFVFK